jgi:hypothetical protein
LLCDDELSRRSPDYTHASEIEEFPKRIKEYYQVEWFRNQTASWNNLYQPIFTEVLTKRGFGFAFNMLPDTKLFTKE